MIEHSWQVLEYDRLLEILSRYASSPLGRSECLSFVPSSDTKKITHELGLVSEMRLLLKTSGFPAFTDLRDLRPLLDRARARGAHLEPEEFLMVLRLAESARTVRGLLQRERTLYPGLANILDRMPDLTALIKKLKKTIAPNGTIRDGATPVLDRIRHQRRRQRSRLEKKLSQIRMTKGLGRNSNDHLVTVRDGRYVISIRSDLKSLFGGIVHDYSRTRSTCFVEPVEVIEDNNRSTELALEEKAEEDRILVDLTGAVREMSPEILRAEDLIARLDGLYARARYAEDLSCVPAEIDDARGVFLKQAQNPILLSLWRTGEKDKTEKPVAVDIRLENERRVFIISGPNRGGKTVSLKTLGLMALMTQAGMHIPAAEGSCLPVFDHCMADIGDEQDMQAGLSTFSAHAENLKRILESAGPKSLVIIDEPGMGTDPNEGAALTMAVLDELSQRASFVALATHLNRLKAYGLSNPAILNASVVFDRACHRPTFRLQYGAPGISHALETARALGMPTTVLEKARAYLDQGDVELNHIIEKMHRLTAEVATVKKEAEEAKERHLAAAQETRTHLARLDEEKQALTEAYRQKAEQVIISAREELKETINLLKSPERSARAEASRRFRAVTDALSAHFEPAKTMPRSGEPGPLKEGQRVFHARLKQHGVIQSVDMAGGRASVLMGNMKISTDVRDLQPVHTKTPPPRPVNAELARATLWKSGREGARPGRLNVIGYHVDEAIPLVDRAVDRALLEGRMSVTIIHGHGTGRLRGAIRDHLRAMPFVKGVASAEPRAGGDAATVVELA